MRAVSLTKVLSSERIDIAKFDCEGCEYSLLSVPCDIIRKIPKYVIEYHRGLEKLTTMFENCGFSCELLVRKEKDIGIFKSIKKI